jgi:hypothetical protein
MGDAADTLQLARIAAESLFGAERVGLEAPASVDSPGRRVTIASATEAGRALAVLFLAYARREFGPAAVACTTPATRALASEADGGRE